MVMNVLITGANGFVGRHACAEFARAGHRVTTHDLDAADRTADIRDADAVRAMVAEVRPDGIVHLAGLAFAPAAWADPRRTYEINLLGTVNVLEAVRDVKPDTRTLVVSSAAVYAQETEGLLDERSRLDPVDPYGLSKMAADLTALRWAARERLPFMTARPINHTGPGQQAQYVTSAFAAQLKAIAAGTREPVMRVGNLDSRRDFMDVRDVARAYRLLVEKGRPGEAYNIATGRLIAIHTLLDTLCDIAGVRPAIEVAPERYRPTDTSPVLDTGKIRRDTGWQPELPLDQTLRDLYATVEDGVIG